MNEYETFNNNELEWQSNNVYYLPHHGVLKEGSLKTKPRVVFNVSTKTKRGIEPSILVNHEHWCSGPP